MVLRMKCENFVVAAEIPCEWKFATKFASDCECDGLVHSDPNRPQTDIHPEGNQLPITDTESCSQGNLIAITETDLWEFQQKSSQYRYSFSLEFKLMSITDTDFGLETN